MNQPYPPSFEEMWEYIHELRKIYIKEIIKKEKNRKHETTGSQNLQTRQGRKS